MKNYQPKPQANDHPLNKKNTAKQAYPEITFQVPTGNKLNIVIALQTLILCWAQAMALNLF